MSTIKNLTVESSNVTVNNSFCNKLVSKTEIITPTVFGNSISQTQETYYLFTDKANAKGFTAQLDIANFDVVEKPFEITNDKGIAETIQLKYLYPRR